MKFKVQWEIAPDIKQAAEELLVKLEMPHISPQRLIFMRSQGSKSRALARIWSFPRIWQLALKKESHYIIEVIAEHFDKLSSDEKIRVLIHELMHIPTSFSGALVPHKSGKRRINAKTVEHFFKVFKASDKIKNV